MFVVSAQQVVDGTHYEPQCTVVQAMMTPTAPPTVTPAPTTSLPPTTTHVLLSVGACDERDEDVDVPDVRARVR